MLDGLVGAHGVHVLGVWGLGEVGEGAGLHNNLIDSVTCNVSYLCISFYSLQKHTCSHIPLIKRPVLGAGHELEVIQGPGDAGDLALVPLQHVQGLKGDGVVNVDGVLQSKDIDCGYNRLLF